MKNNYSHLTLENARSLIQTNGTPKSLYTIQFHRQSRPYPATEFRSAATQHATNASHSIAPTRPTLSSALLSAFLSMCSKNSALFLGQRPCVQPHCLAWKKKRVPFLSWCNTACHLYAISLPLHPLLLRLHTKIIKFDQLLDPASRCNACCTGIKSNSYILTRRYHRQRQTVPHAVSTSPFLSSLPSHSQSLLPTFSSRTSPGRIYRLPRCSDGRERTASSG